MAKKLTHPGKLDEMLEFLGGQFRFDPAYARALLGQQFPEIGEAWRKSECPNCRASMEMYSVVMDYNKAKLILAMAAKVRDWSTRMPFNEANRIHIPTLDVSDQVRHVVSQARTLGLVAKVKNARGKHIQGTWLLTKRAWDAIAGLRVPAEVVVWRNTIQERKDSTTTIEDVLRKRGEGFTPFTVAGTHEGEVF